MNRYILNGAFIPVSKHPLKYNEVLKHHLTINLFEGIIL